jgi:hypothetical protein
MPSIVSHIALILAAVAPLPRLVIMSEPEGTDPMPEAPKDPSMEPVETETTVESPKKAPEDSEMKDAEEPKHHESPRLKISLRKDPPPVEEEEEDKSESEEGQITEEPEKPAESPVQPEPSKEEEKSSTPPAAPQPESSPEPVKEEGEEEEPTESKESEEPKKKEEKEEENEEEKEEDSKMEVDDSDKVDEEEDEKPVEDNDNDNEGSRGDGEGSQGDAGEESTTSKASELPYSTRGRSATGNEPAGSESWERSTREALDDLGRVKETPATLGTSFLEALSEEERRTRTRFLPDVEGMHVLRKFEVKDDLVLARSIASGAGVTSLSSSKKKGKRVRDEDDDGMDVDEDDGTSPSEDDHGSDIGRLGTTTLELPSRDLVVPSNAFIPPTGSQSSSSNGDADGPRATTAPSKGPKDTVSPLLVDSVTAFNPPRPPESIGAKKKHRMLRWERRPEDVEVDLGNYRKTVARTRQELHNAESEYERLETIDAHLRWHFLGHLNLLNEEYLRLNEELNGVQQECVKAADLLTSRTRSRGAGKGSYAMRDVLAVLKARGGEGKDQDETQAVEPSTDAPVPCSVGIGGLGKMAFVDWDQETCFTSRKPATAWVVPGDTVQTAYGEGTILEVRAVVIPTTSGEPAPVNQNGSKGDSTKSPGKKKKEKAAVIDAALSKLNTVMPPSVRVQMPYGVGHFPLASVTSKVDPSVYSDTQLAVRWKGMLESALAVGACLDVEGMIDDIGAAPAVKDVVDGPENDESAPMDTENGAVEEDKDEDEENSGPSYKGRTIAKSKFLPFGAGLLPTSSGRGSLLHDLPIVEIEKRLNSALFDGGGVLGKVSISRVA